MGSASRDCLGLSTLVQFELCPDLRGCAYNIVCANKTIFVTPAMRKVYLKADNATAHFTTHVFGHFFFFKETSSRRETHFLARDLLKLKTFTKVSETNKKSSEPGVTIPQANESNLVLTSIEKLHFSNQWWVFIILCPLRTKFLELWRNKL